MLNHLKKYLKNFIGLLGLEIRYKKQEVRQVERASMYGCLQQAVKNGLKPETVIDVGAASGTFPLYEIFPEANHILIEPLEEFTSNLSQIVDKLGKAEHICAAAASQPGKIIINVHPDLVGSSIFKEEEDSDVNGIERTVTTVTLDNICRDRRARKPYLIKIDTQGSELEVLKGAENIINDAAFIILEVSLFAFFEGGAQFYDCIEFMKQRGFVVYDVFDLQYRLVDGAMSQADIAFVKDESKFREVHFYASKEQRKQQTKQLKKAIRE